MRRLAPLGALAGALAHAACGNGAVDARSPSPAASSPMSPIEVVVGEPVPHLPATEGDAARARPRDDALPRTWTAPSIPGLSFADALRRARTARDAFERLAPPATSATATSATATSATATGMKTWFARVQVLVDQASRMYAAAFHAADAPRDGRIDAIAEAAELDMTVARSLDDAGLATLPVAWRTDPTIASSFEDVAVGPTRRWRDEARVLARQCVDTARDAGVVTDAARRCAALRTGSSAKAKRAPAANAGCACSPGDPLCSASLGGWCAPAAAP